jgi:hypothetical protein
MTGRLVATLLIALTLAAPVGAQDAGTSTRSIAPMSGG